MQDVTATKLQCQNIPVGGGGPVGFGVRVDERIEVIVNMHTKKVGGGGGSGWMCTRNLLKLLSKCKKQVGSGRGGQGGCVQRIN